MRIRVLGTVGVVADDGIEIDLTDRERLVLTVLAVNHGSTVSRDKISHVIWGENPPKTAATTLQVYVSRLRSSLEPERSARSEGSYIQTVGEGYRLELDKDRYDAVEFEGVVKAARTAFAEGDTEGALGCFEAALKLWRGRALGEFSDFAWAQPVAARLESLGIDAFEGLHAARLATGRHVEAIGDLQLLVDRHPYRERLASMLMLALYRAGRQTDALAVYQSTRRHLIEDLGVEPGRELRDLEQAILAHDVSLAFPTVAPALPRSQSERSATDAVFMAAEGSGHHAVSSWYANAGEACRAAAGPSILRAALVAADPTGTDEAVEAAESGARSLLAAASSSQVLVSATAIHRVRALRPGGFELDELGDHQLVDLLPAKPVWELKGPDADGTSHPIRSVSTATHNLRSELTPLFGRSVELAEVTAMVGESTLVTLTGSAGVGKTRLARHAAAQLAHDFSDGVWMVELGEVEDPELVAQAASEVLRLRDRADGPAVVSLTRGLRDREALIVLDNCEHLLEAAADVVSTILHHCPAVKILATSRERLGVVTERTFVVPPLATSSQKGESPDAVRLFINRIPRAASLHLDPQQLRGLCDRLDGLPLAIELAAAGVPSLGLDGLQVALDARVDLLVPGRDRPTRHRSVQSAIAWSWSLASEEERRLLARLSVFPARFTIEAATAVCSDEMIDEPSVLAALVRLVEKSLVSVDPGEQTRYRLLETVRSFAANRLDDNGRGDQSRRRHAHWVAGQVFATTSSKSGRARPRLRDHGPDVRSALDWFEANQPGDQHLVTVGILAFHWYRTGRLHEGRTRLARALDVSVDADPTVRAMALAGAAFLAWNQADFDEVDARLAEAVPLAERAGGLALVEHLIGASGWGKGDLELSERHLGRALEMSLPRRQRLTVLEMLASVAWFRGDYALAAERYRTAQTEATRIGDAHMIAHSLRGEGLMLVYCGEIERGSARCSQSLALARKFADDVSLGQALAMAGAVDAIRGDTRMAGERFAEGLRHSMAQFDQLALGLEVIGAAKLAGDDGRFRDAVTLLGWFDEIAATRRLLLAPHESEARRQVATAATRALGPEEYERVHLAGALLSEEELLAAVCGPAPTPGGIRTEEGRRSARAE